MKKDILRKYETFLVALIAFLFFLLFFYHIHPLVIFDTDDWMYTYLQRDAKLQWRGWNPTRVLPEILMPIVTLVGKSIFGLFVQDHFSAISLSYAVTLSLTIAIMIYFLYRLLKTSSAPLTFLLYFLICHFWIFRTADSGNNYMFKTTNSTCVFFYVIPNLLNCILVLWIMQMQLSGETISKSFFQMSDKSKSIFVFLLYFSIYSNLWASILLAVYVSVAALFDGIRLFVKKQFALAEYLKTHIIEISIVLLWAIQQVFEINGERAAGLSFSSYADGLWATLHVCVDLLHAMNKYFLLGAIALAILGVVVAFVHKDHESSWKLLILFSNFVIVILYLILSCARTGAGYLYRQDVQYCGFFLGMLFLIVCANTVLKWYPVWKTVWPLLLAIAVCNCNTSTRTYGESTVGGYPPSACMRVCNDIMQQFLDAEAEGKSQIILKVPDFQSADGWPIANYGGPRFSSHFYKLGVTEKYIEVTEIHYTYEKNVELHIAEDLR